MTQQGQWGQKGHKINRAKSVKIHYLFCFSYVQRSLSTLPGKIAIVVRTPYTIDAVITHMITCSKSIFCNIPRGEGNLSPMIQIIQNCHWCKISYLSAKVRIYTPFSHRRTYYILVSICHCHTPSLITRYITIILCESPAERGIVINLLSFEKITPLAQLRSQRSILLKTLKYSLRVRGFTVSVL